MDDEKLCAGEISAKSRVGKWFENFWYHYKWPVIGVAFALIVILICTLQTCEKEDEDISVLYAGPVLMTNSELDGVRAVMNGVLPADYNNDGKKYTEMVTFQIFSEEQIKEIEAQTYANGDRGSVNGNYNTTNYETYYNYLLTGETSVLLLDPSLYRALASGGRLQKLSDILGYSPSGVADDGFGVAVSELDIYKYYTVMQILPADTMVCILKPYVTGKISKEKYYTHDREMLTSFVGFKEKGEQN